MTDADEPVVDADLEQRFVASAGIQAAITEARAHPERRVPRRDRRVEREALRRSEDSGE